MYFLVFFSKTPCVYETSFLLASRGVECQARHFLAGPESGLVPPCFRAPVLVSGTDVLRGLCKARPYHEGFFFPSKVGYNMLATILGIPGGASITSFITNDSNS